MASKYPKPFNPNLRLSAAGSRKHDIEGPFNGAELVSAGWQEEATEDTVQARMGELSRRDTEHYVFVSRFLAKYPPVDPSVKNSRYRRRIRAWASNWGLRTLNCTVNEKEEIYCQLRVQHGYAHQAATRASKCVVGIADRLEDLYMCKHHIRMRMKELRDHVKQAAGVSKDDVLQGMMNAVALASDSFELLQAWKEIGKFLGHYEETKIRIEQSVKQTVHHTHSIEGLDMRMLTDEALLRHASPKMLEQLKGMKLSKGDTIEDAEFVEVKRDE